MSLWVCIIGANYTRKQSINRLSGLKDQYLLTLRGYISTGNEVIKLSHMKLIQCLFAAMETCPERKSNLPKYSL